MTRILSYSPVLISSKSSDFSNVYARFHLHPSKVYKASRIQYWTDSQTCEILRFAEWGKDSHMAG
jgi:hypothetical protein